jgi:DNA-binding PadR family transcriptional regulator
MKKGLLTKRHLPGRRPEYVLTSALGSEEVKLILGIEKSPLPENLYRLLKVLSEQTGKFSTAVELSFLLGVQNSAIYKLLEELASKKMMERIREEGFPNIYSLTEEGRGELALESVREEYEARADDILKDVSFVGWRGNWKAQTFKAAKELFRFMPESGRRYLGAVELKLLREYMRKRHGLDMPEGSLQEALRLSIQEQQQRRRREKRNVEYRRDRGPSYNKRRLTKKQLEVLAVMKTICEKTGRGHVSYKEIFGGIKGVSWPELHERIKALIARNKIFRFGPRGRPRLAFPPSGEEAGELRQRIKNNEFPAVCSTLLPLPNIDRVLGIEERKLFQRILREGVRGITMTYLRNYTGFGYDVVSRRIKYMKEVGYVKIGRISNAKGNVTDRSPMVVYATEDGKKRWLDALRDAGIGNVEGYLKALETAELP